MRIPAKFTLPGPFGHEIGQLADAMTRRTRDRSPDAMGVVPKRGRDHAHRHLHEKVPRLTGSRLLARRAARSGNTTAGRTYQPCCRCSGNRIGSPWNLRQAQDAGVGEGHAAPVSQMPSSACRAARWPAWTAPSIYPLHALAVSVAAHLIGPIGSLSAAPKWSRPHGPVFEL